MNYPTTLYRGQEYLIVPDEAHLNAALNEGWTIGHPDLVGLPVKFRGKIPKPAPRFQMAIVEPIKQSDVMPKEEVITPKDPVFTEEEYQKIYKERFANKRPLRNGNPTKHYANWKETHGYRT